MKAHEHKDIEVLEPVVTELHVPCLPSFWGHQCNIVRWWGGGGCSMDRWTYHYQLTKYNDWGFCFVLFFVFLTLDKMTQILQKSWKNLMICCKHISKYSKFSAKVNEFWYWSKNVVNTFLILRQKQTNKLILPNCKCKIWPIAVIYLGPTYFLFHCYTSKLWGCVCVCTSLFF